MNSHEFTAGQIETVRAALQDAIEWRTPVCGNCPDCAAAGACCADHQRDASLSGAYAQLYRELGGMPVIPDDRRLAFVTEHICSICLEKWDGNCDCRCTRPHRQLGEVQP